MDSLLEAGDFGALWKKRQGIKISVPEEIGYINGWISGEELGSGGGEIWKVPPMARI